MQNVTNPVSLPAWETLLVAMLPPA